MQHHGNKTLNQRVFKGIECSTMETRLEFLKVLNAISLYIKEFLKVLNAISWKQDFKSKSF